MSSEKTNISITNDTNDIVSSVLLNDLTNALQHKFNISSNDIIRKNSTIENTKCDITIAITFVTTVAASVISAVIAEYIKVIFERNKSKVSGKEWRLSVNVDKPLYFVVKEDSEANVVCVEINDVQNSSENNK